MYTGLAALALAAAAQSSNALSLGQRNAHPRAEESLRRRQSSNDSVPAALNIAPSQYWEGNDGPWSTFPLQVGSGNEGGLQNIRVMMSTAATAIWTISAKGCPNDYIDDCEDLRGGLFLPNESLTWVPQSSYETGVATNLGMGTSGPVGYDTVTLGWQGSSNELTDKHTLVWNLYDSLYWIGVYGLNPRPTNLSDFSNPQTSLLQKLYDNDDIPSLSYGYTAGNQYRLDKVYGSLTLGGYDTSRFEANNISFPFYEDISRDLSVNLQSISTTKTSPSNLLPDGSISIFIDSTVPELWLPESACEAFEDAFGIAYNDDYQHYILTSSMRDGLLEQNAQVTFTLGPDVNGGKTVDITLPYAAFDLQLEFPNVPKSSNTTYYYFPLQKAANSSQYTLGRTFLQEAYLFADYGNQNFSVSQCVWDQETIADQKLVTVLSPERKQQTEGSSDEDDGSISTGAIVGVVIGVVAAIAIIGVILFFVRRRRNTQKRERAELDAEDAAKMSQQDSIHSMQKHQEGDDSGSSAAPTGGELDSDGTRVHEMSAATGKMPPQEMEGAYRADPKYQGYSEMPTAQTGFATEMPGSQPIYEMPADEVHELPGSTKVQYNEKGTGFF